MPRVLKDITANHNNIRFLQPLTPYYHQAKPALQPPLPPLPPVEQFVTIHEPITQPLSPSPEYLPIPLDEPTTQQSSQDQPIESSDSPDEDRLSPFTSFNNPTNQRFRYIRQKSTRPALLDDMTWILLQIMLGVYGAMAVDYSGTFRDRVWLHALEFYKDELYIQLKDKPNVGVLIVYLRSVTVLKLKDKWKRLKKKYVDIRRENGLTEIGGFHPNITWKFYDEMGHILKDDLNIHPEHRNTQNFLSGEDKEIQASERAKRKGVKRISQQEINDKILSPASRPGDASILSIPITGSAPSSSNICESTPSSDSVTSFDSINSYDSIDSPIYDQEMTSNSAFFSEIREAVTRFQRESSERWQRDMRDFKRMVEEQNCIRLEKMQAICEEDRRRQNEFYENLMNRISQNGFAPSTSTSTTTTDTNIPTFFHVSYQ